MISGFSQERGTLYTTLDDYLTSLKALADATPKGGTLLYNQAISFCREIAERKDSLIKSATYQPLDYHELNKQAYLITPQGEIPVTYVDHSLLEAIPAAQLLLQNLGIDEKQFYQAIPSFSMD